LIWVEGEISNLSVPASGHAYFSLKDDKSQVRCALFRPKRLALAWEPRNGARVLARARVSLYEGRGEFQLIVDYAEDAGEGALRRALEELKRKLALEGLFDAARKRPLPRLPRCVAVITSASGAAVRDIITTFRRRFPAVRLVIVPVPVQGADAAPAMVGALKRIAEHGGCDAAILARGGGSLEDLWAFNDETLARAIAQSPVPVVSGVGHETDFTIADLVADYRAATPTAAAQALCPDRTEWLADLAHRRRRLALAGQRRLEASWQRLDGLTRGLVHPRTRITQYRIALETVMKHLQGAVGMRLHRGHAVLDSRRERLFRHGPIARLASQSTAFASMGARLEQVARVHFSRRRQDLYALASRLQAISPLATLERGYALVFAADGRALVRARSVIPPAEVSVRMSDGFLDCTVTAVRRT
jgi:exodeoxyribonuclease VII large subunit